MLSCSVHAFLMALCIHFTPMLLRSQETLLESARATELCTGRRQFNLGAVGFLPSKRKSSSLLGRKAVMVKTKSGNSQNMSLATVFSPSAVSQGFHQPFTKLSTGRSLPPFCSGLCSFLTGLLAGRQAPLGGTARIGSLAGTNPLS